MGVRYDEDTGEFIRYSEDEAPEVVYRGEDDDFITQAQRSQILSEQAASEAARTAAEAARMAPYYDLYQSPKVSYSGQPVSNSVSVGGYNLPEGTFADDDGRVRVRGDDGGTSIFRDEEGEPVRLSSYGSEPRELTPDSYDNAKNMYSRGYVPWNIDNVYEGLSSRQPFSLNALWGGTQYAQGRVTDWSHLDPTQYEANLIAANTRNELWNEYDKLVTQGAPPAKNPDEVALDFYVKNVGPNGNTFGYGPGANTALITEAVKHQFLNSPDVIQARGTTYQTPQEKIAKIDSFGPAHQAGVPTWQVFEKQGYSSGFSIGSLIPMIVGAIALGPMAAAFAGTLGTVGGYALAGALIGGTTAEIGGGDFLKGALTGAVGSAAGSALSGGLGATASQAELASMVESGTSGLSGAALEASSLSSGISGISSTLVEAGLPKPIADAVVKAATVAVKTGIAGGDIEQAVLGSLVNSGVGAGVSEGLSEADITKEIAKAITGIATPVISTAIQGGDVSTVLTNTLVDSGFALAGNTINEVLNTANQNSRDVEAQAGYNDPTQTATAPVVPEIPSPLQSANAETTSLAVDSAWGVNPPSQDIGDMIGSDKPVSSDAVLADTSGDIAEVPESVIDIAESFPTEVAPAASTEPEGGLNAIADATIPAVDLDTTAPVFVSEEPIPENLLTTGNTEGETAALDIPIAPDTQLAEAPTSETIADFQDLISEAIPTSTDAVTAANNSLSDVIAEAGLSDTGLVNNYFDEPSFADITSNGDIYKAPDSVTDIAENISIDDTPVTSVEPKGALTTMAEAPIFDLDTTAPAVVSEEPVSENLLTTDFAQDKPVGGLNALADSTIPEIDLDTTAPAVVSEEPVSENLLTTDFAQDKPVGGLNFVAQEDQETPEANMESSTGLKATDFTKPIVATAGKLLKQKFNKRRPVQSGLRPVSGLQMAKPAPKKLTPPPQRMDLSKLFPIQRASRISPPKTLANNTGLSRITNIETLASLLKRA